MQSTTQSMQQLQSLIETGFADRANLSPKNVPADIKNAVDEIVELLNSGKARIAEKINGQWQVHEWLKKAVLLYFRINDNEIIRSGMTQYFDKVPLKYSEYSHDEIGTSCRQWVRRSPPGKSSCSTMTPFETTW